MSSKNRKNAANLQINPEKLESTTKKQWIIKTIELFKEGFSSNYIREFLEKNKTGSRSVQAINIVIAEANAEIKNSQFSKQQEIIPIHLNKYHNQALRLLAVRDFTEQDVLSGKTDWEGFYKARDRKIKACNDCLQTILQKEQLLGYHREGFTLEINTEETVEIREEKPEFDVSEISFEEQLELYKLVKEAREDENELLAVIMTDKQASDQITVDVQHEIVETANVEQITKIELPEPIKKSEVTASDPTIKLRESLKLLAAKKFHEVGTLTEDEKELLNK
jgi:hypothetical protein